MSLDGKKPEKKSVVESIRSTVEANFIPEAPRLRQAHVDPNDVPQAFSLNDAIPDQLVGTRQPTPPSVLPPLEQHRSNASSNGEHVAGHFSPTRPTTSRGLPPVSRSNAISSAHAGQPTQHSSTSRAPSTPKGNRGGRGM